MNGKAGETRPGCFCAKDCLKILEKLYPTEHKDQIYPGYIYQGLVRSGKEFHLWI